MIVPPQGRAAVLQESHPGMSRMKALAKMYAWWPGINSDVKIVIRKCKSCEENHSKPRNAPLHPWEWPAKPWTRLHMYYAGPFMGHMFLVLVDVTSEWIESEIVNKADSESAIEVLRKIFEMHGLPIRIIMTMPYLSVS